MKRMSVLFAVLLILALLVSCAPKPETTPTPVPTPTPEQPKYGGILHYWASRNPAGFDLHAIPSWGPLPCQLVFNNMVSFDPKKGELVPENLIGDLAERWEITPDGKTFTFFLNRGVKWHDGNPFTADDVVYSMEKMVDPKRSRIGKYFPSFGSVEKVDDYTVKMHLKTPSPSFLSQLAGAYAVIQAKHLAGTDGKSTDFLVGTGPYKFKSYTEPVIFETVRNPDYFKEGLPYVDGITINFITELSTQVDTLLTKRVDMTSPGVGFRSKEQTDRVAQEAPEVKIQFVSYPYAFAYKVNMNYEPLKDPRVRRALSLLADPQNLTVASTGGLEFGWTERVLFPSQWELPKDEAWKIMRWDKPFEERVTEAKKLMAEAGYADGFKLRIVSANSVDFERTHIAYADVLQRYLNMDVKLDLPLPAISREKRAAGDFDLYYENFYCLLGDLDEWGDSFVTGGNANYMSYSNPTVDRLFEEQSQTMDFAKRQALAHEILRILYTDLPAIPAGRFNTYAMAWQPYVKGFTPGHSGYAVSHIMMEHVWLDK
ncbi:ABC transporter substrate-binding protein [Chloroflexota bacterium]